MTIVYRVGDEGAVVLGLDGEPLARLRPGALIYGDSVEAIDPTEALPIQKRMQRYADKMLRPAEDKSL